MNVERSIPVPVVNRTTPGTCPPSETQILDSGVFPATDTARLGGSEEPVHSDDDGAVFFGLTLQFADEFGKTEITDPFAVSPLQGLHVQVFEADDVILADNLQREFPVEVVPCRCHMPVLTGKAQPRAPAVVGTALLLAEFPTGDADLFHVVMQEQGRAEILPVGSRQKKLEPEVVTDAFTRSRYVSWPGFRLTDEDDVVIAHGIPLDRERLDPALDLAGLEKFEGLFPDPDTVAAFVPVSSLLQGEGAVSVPLPERRRRAADMTLPVLEKEPVATFNALHDILDGLRTELIPEAVTRQFLELGEVFLERVLGEVTTEQSVIASVQRDAMVVDAGCDLYPAAELAVVPGCVELEPECFHGKKLLESRYEVKYNSLAACGRIKGIARTIPVLSDAVFIRSFPGRNG